MDWPAYSPDLNPIEHVWDALGRRIAARLHHLEKTQQLKQKLIEECANLPQEMLHQLILSMQKLCEATIAFLGKQDAISNRTPLKIKMDRLKLKLELVESLSASPPTSKSVETDYEGNSVVIPFAKKIETL
ncbi:transposable element Tcb2 transposase [Trichonephila clavipes]|uniref:Transposable element Tcb2 transposase n=1 Tax=Trichonephila clavipes TaxID=2585209 RepID=A0A8X6V8N6_TRICX|nr:transposable element Tcb2 transposase [Trichonephila clavipes]